MNKSELVEFLKELLKLQSFNPTQSKVPDLIVSTLKKYGIMPEVIVSNGYKSITAKTKGEPKVLFNGHWDTVLPSEELNKNELNITEDEEFIYGLGACDMKSGVAAIVSAFIRAHQEGIEGVMINLVPDEELGGENGTKVLIDKGFIAPNVIICEPTNLNISLGQKGALFTKVIAKGLSSHGAYPNRGDNAVLKMINFGSELAKAYPNPSKEITPDDLFEIVTANINKINGGSSQNVIADLCTAEIDIRIPPKVNLDEVKKQLNKIAKSTNVEINFEIEAVGWELNKDTNLFKTATDVFKKLNINTDYVRKMGSNDGKYYVDAGSNIINIGPGDNKLSHTLNEKVSKNELDQADKIYFLICKLL